jgi:hypothetical protein
MTKLCLGSYLNVLTTNKINKRTASQVGILNKLVESICIPPKTISDQEASKIAHGRKNIEDYILHAIDEAGYDDTEKFYKQFISKVQPLLNPGKHLEIAKTLAYIIANDDDISIDSKIDYVSPTIKKDIGSIANPLRFIAGVFLYVLECTENTNCKIYAEAINNDFCRFAIKEYDEKIQSTPYNEALQINLHTDLKAQANAFLQRYEESRELLPLCQIANILDPGHNYTNKMYSEYCTCSETLQKQIMLSIDCSIIDDIDKNKLFSLITRFEEDALKAELISQDKLYALPQYFSKTMRYDSELENPDPTIFPAVPLPILPNRRTASMSSFIMSYLNLKGTEHALPIPFDWMWEYFYNSPEIDLVFGINLFIVSCHCVVPRINYLERKPKKNLVIPSIYDVKTMEDLYFLALLSLYDAYMN